MSFDWLDFEWVLQNPYMAIFILWAIISILSKQPGLAFFFLALPLAAIVYFINKPALPIIPAGASELAINNTPDQKMLLKDSLFEYHQQHHLRALAAYVITGRVLSVKPYSEGASPVDIVLGWGQMSDPNIVPKLNITQDNHFYRVSAVEGGQLPIPEQQIRINTSNNHILPASFVVESKIEKLRRGQIVSLGGYLVNIEDPRGINLKTSLKRDDTDSNSSEIFYVQSIKVF
jgi:hypothetical protein